jgi:hypothetical protein
MDPVDAVQGSPVQGELFGMLRAWATWEEREWPRLRLVLAMSTTPSRLEANPNQSVLQLCPPIRLGAFDVTECAGLLRRHGFGEGDAPAVLAATGGHPWLLRTLLYRANQLGMTPAAVLERPTEELDWFLSGYRKRLLRMDGGTVADVRELATRGSLQLPHDRGQRLVEIGVADVAPDGTCRLRASLLRRLATA